MSKAYVIRKVEAHWGKMPVNVSFSYGKVDVFPFLLFRLFAGDFEGTGEVLLEPNGFTDELARFMLGRDAKCLDKLLPPAKNDVDRIMCEGISMALHDLVGHVSGLPLWALLGGAKVTTVPLMPCIFPTNPDEAEESADRFFRQGYRYIKTKLVGDLEEDSARVRAIRSVSPNGVVLQGDANEGYRTLHEARRAVDELGRAGLDVFEDPLAGGVEDYVQLKGTSGAKIMVDALARRTDDLVTVLRMGAADVIGVHPDQPGSLSRALLHANLAKSFGVPVVIGGTGYTAVGTAAYQHLTAVAAPGGPCGELGGHVDHGMPRSVVRQQLPVENGCVLLSDAPGIGVELDEEALLQYEHGRMEWTV